MQGIMGKLLSECLQTSMLVKKAQIFIKSLAPFHGIKARSYHKSLLSSESDSHWMHSYLWPYAKK